MTWEQQRQDSHRESARGVMKQGCNMGLIQLCVVCFLIGCGAENTAPPPLYTAASRDH